MYWSSLSIKNRWLSFFKKWLNILYARCYDLMVRAVIKKADLIIALSKYLKEELINYYKVDENKIAIVYNWCDMNDWKLKSHDDNYLSVVFTWADYCRKWLTVLEWVAEKLKDEKIKFKIIWVDSYKPSLKNITSLWRLKREDVYENMENSDVIFLPSFYEWQPLVLLEAMSFGCMPVYSKNCHMDMLETTIFKDFVSENNLVDDYVSIFRKIIEMKNIDEYRKFAKEFVSKYTWDNQVKYYIDLINKL